MPVCIPCSFFMLISCIFSLLSFSLFLSLYLSRSLFLFLHTQSDPDVRLGCWSPRRSATPRRIHEGVLIVDVTGYVPCEHFPSPYLCIVCLEVDGGGVGVVRRCFARAVSVYDFVNIWTSALNTPGLFVDFINPQRPFL